MTRVLIPTVPLLLMFLAGRAAADEPTLAVDLDVFARAEYTTRAGEALTQFRLDRGELGGSVGLGPDAAAEVRLEALRSAAEGGALGVDGDTLVTRVKRAYVRGHHALGPVVLDGALGLAPDPWIAAVDEGDPTGPLSRSASERLLAWSPSDLAVVVRGALGPIRATLAVGNGEGLAYPERNTGKSTTGMLEGSPTTGVRIFAMARDGSIGAASVRDHRFGGGASVATTYLSGGFEVVRALGLDGRGELTGTVVGGWVEGRPLDHVIVAMRGGLLQLPADGRRLTFGGAVAVEPWRADASRLRLWLAVERTSSDGLGMPLPTDPGDATTAMLIVSATAHHATRE